MPKTSAQTASTMDRIEQTVFVAAQALYAHLPIIIFRLHRSSPSISFETSYHRRTPFFRIHLFGGINAFLLEYDRFDHNGQETDNTCKEQSATGFSFKSFKSIGIRCRNKEVREDIGCACYPNHDGYFSSIVSDISSFSPSQDASSFVAL